MPRTNIGCGTIFLFVGTLVVIGTALMMYCEFAPKPDFLRDEVCRKMERVDYDYTRADELDWDVYDASKLQSMYSFDNGDSEALRYYCEEHDRKDYWGFQ